MAALCFAFELAHDLNCAWVFVREHVNIDAKSMKIFLCHQPPPSKPMFRFSISFFILQPTTINHCEVQEASL
jgi:hypothetical protein